MVDDARERGFSSGRGGYLDDLLTKPAPEVEAASETLPSLDKLSPLPGPGDPYKAFARPSHQMLTTLFVIRGDEKRGFPFGDLDGPDMLPGESANQGPVIVMRFARIFPTEVILIGRNLDELYNYLGDHRIRWVRCLPEGKMIKDRDVPVITEIVVRPLKRPDDEE